MPIHIILGKPGSGKSMYAVYQLIKELAEGERNVVTNLPLRVDKLNEYLQRRYPGQDCRMVQRLKVLTDEELREFWKFRGPHVAKPDAPDELPAFKFEQNPLHTPEVNLKMFELAQAEYQARLAQSVTHFQKWYPAFCDEQGSKGVAYFLDEAHIAFNARDWATLGRNAIHYMSQHRKLGDVVWPITQSPGNLDKQFRSVAEDFTVLRNEYTAKFGLFRGRGRFVRRTYLAEPTGNAEPFETASFSLDREGVAGCYDTARGIGVHGNKADIGRRAKGIPIWTVIPGALVLACCCVFVPWLAGRGVTKAIAGPGKKVAQAVAAKTEMAVPAAKVVPKVEVKSEPLPAVQKVSEWQGVDVRGYLTGVRGTRVLLSDGRILEAGDGVLATVYPSRVVLTDGTVLWRRDAAHSANKSPGGKPDISNRVSTSSSSVSHMPVVGERRPPEVRAQSDREKFGLPSSFGAMVSGSSQSPGKASPRGSPGHANK